MNDVHKLIAKLEVLFERIKNHPTLQTDLAAAPYKGDPRLQTIVYFRKDYMPPWGARHLNRYETNAWLLLQDQFEWAEIMNMRSRIRRRRRHFDFTIIATTDEIEFKRLRRCEVLTVSTPIANFSSDEAFLRDLGIDPKTCKVEYRDHRVLKSMKIRPFDIPASKK